VAEPGISACCPTTNGELRECYLAQGRAISEEFKREPAYAYEKDVIPRPGAPSLAVQ
jgi:hypothetical protein